MLMYLYEVTSLPCHNNLSFNAAILRNSGNKSESYIMVVLMGNKSGVEYIQFKQLKVKLIK